MAGRTLAHYEILGLLGEGGMGVVYRARDAKLGREVALKILPPEMAADAGLQARFEREARAIAALNHPNIVTLHSIEEMDGVRFITMELVEGAPLSEQATPGQGLPLETFLDLAVPISDALSAAHAKGITHRDLKPANIMRDLAGRVKVLDFGLAKLAVPDADSAETAWQADPAGDATAEGRIVGTTPYMSPEQAEGKPIDARSDVFSLGIVFYELLAGRRPFDGDTQISTLSAILKDDPVPLGEVRTDIPGELVAVVGTCLSKDRRNRYETASEVREALLAIRGQAGAGSRSLSPAETTATAAVTPSIAVMPFANLSSDPENEYFSDGLAEELLNVLARNPGLKVVGRTSSFAFKGTSDDLRTIGTRLGVANILEGSVRKAGSRVRINAQLVNAADGFHLWSETYDRVLEDIFALQDEIAASVATALEVALRGSGPAPRPVNAEGFTLSLRAAKVMSQWTASSTNVAADLYRQAIDLDEKDARAWAGLARALVVRAAFGFDDHAEMVRRASEAAATALALDDRSAEAHEVAGHLHFAFEHDFAAAARSFQRAHELAPSSSQMLGSAAMVRIAQKDFETGLAQLHKAVELDPLSAEAHFNVGRFSYYAGRLDESLAALGRSLELSPEMTSVWGLTGLVLCETGDLDEALAAVEREASPGYLATSRAVVYHLRGDHEASDRALQVLKGDDSWGFQLAMAHAVREELDEAFAALEAAAGGGDAGIPWTHVHPLLRNLHGDSRWPGLLEAIGLGELGA